jgi:UDP-N-acetylenolpyruvoylglucosamine reductase
LPGGARVSEKARRLHSKPLASEQRNVKEALEHIRKTVYDRFGIELVPEIKIL